ncbi:MAG: hypothetical protein Q9192_005736, partial [Flavoplaca navasiana]
LGQRIGRPSPIVDAARINAETAGGMLEECFGDVRMERFPGGFEVRDVEAVMGYLGSWGEEGMTGGQEDEVRRVVEGRIREEGCFRESTTVAGWALVSNTEPRTCDCISVAQTIEVDGSDTEFTRSMGGTLPIPRSEATLRVGVTSERQADSPVGLHPGAGTGCSSALRRMDSKIPAAFWQCSVQSMAVLQHAKISIQGHLISRGIAVQCRCLIMGVVEDTVQRHMIDVLGVEFHLLVAFEHPSHEFHVLCKVPGIEMVEQWTCEIKAAFPKCLVVGDQALEIIFGGWKARDSLVEQMRVAFDGLTHANAAKVKAEDVIDLKHWRTEVEFIVCSRKYVFASHPSSAGVEAEKARDNSNGTNIGIGEAKATLSSKAPNEKEQKDKVQQGEDEEKEMS